MSQLLTSWNCKDEVHLIIANCYSNLIFHRIRSILSCGAIPVLIHKKDLPEEPFHYNNHDQLQELVIEKKLVWLDKEFEHSDLTSCGAAETEFVVDKVFVITNNSEQSNFKKDVFDKCKRLRIPINVHNSAEFCTFTLLSCFKTKAGHLQFGVTTTGNGCHLASRVKRELANSLPSNIDTICEKLGQLRKKIQEEDSKYPSEDLTEDAIQWDDFSNTEPDFYQLSTQFSSILEKVDIHGSQERRLKRQRWLSQMIEYYPFAKLEKLSLEDFSTNYSTVENMTSSTSNIGSISLVGSGPGAVSLLTIEAIHEIMTADLILADKLVPSQIIELIPRSTEVFFARKFPGNAEGAQNELLEIGLKGLKKGQKVVRLKQGDPYIFGRGGEEYLFFNDKGFTPSVVPGITSALSAPVMSAIPTTHRGISNEVLVCTGTNRNGEFPIVPEYVKTRTTIMLMGLHRLAVLQKLLIEKGWDIDVPVAVIERASCPEQRIIRSTLRHIVEAVEMVGSRPPGLLVLGWVCNTLCKSKNIDKWIVEEGNIEGSGLKGSAEISHLLNGVKWY